MTYERGGFVYIMANDRPTSYMGVTNNLMRRVYEHRNGYGSCFTAKYKLKKLVYYEYFETIMMAIIREKQIKDMDRKDKLEMIRRFNLEFKDLYSDVVAMSV